jgi:hypothetical protein
VAVARSAFINYFLQSLYGAQLDLIVNPLIGLVKQVFFENLLFLISNSLLSDFLTHFLSLFVDEQQLFFDVFLDVFLFIFYLI